MKDKRGPFYYPFPANKKVRMYVREENDEICFRMWNQEDPELWMQHGWVPWGAIQQAAAMYNGKAFNPHQAYDLSIAKALIKETQDQT
jgi:hypothetical protein